MNVIENWYDNEYDEWTRLDRHRIEFEITKRYMDIYIKGRNLKILDIGGGPGRYSLYLAQKGHQVTLLDLSQRHIDVAKEKSKECGIALSDYIKGDALDLKAFPSEEFDVVLLMGPLYHLIKLEDRQKAVEEAKRLLKKGGVMITSFISRYAPINEAIAFLDLGSGENQAEQLLHYLEDGVNSDVNGFTVAYFTGIEEAQSLMAQSGLTQLVFAGVENTFCYKERDMVNLPEKDMNQFLDIAFALSQDKNLLGASMHFLYVGQK